MSPAIAMQNGKDSSRKACRSDDEFYADTLAWLLDREVLRKDMKILVVCGGKADRDTLLKTGFQEVTITNLDSQMKHGDFAPFAGRVEDVEALSCEDEEYDVCIAHNGLHHCYSPHRGLLEMFRVSKLGVLVFEPRDSLLTRLGVKLGLGQQYETEAVAANGCVAGGARDSAVPNFVYRWTERDIEKTIRSFCPWGNPRFIYRYALRVPWERLGAMKNQTYHILVRCFLPLMRLFFLCVPKQANGFAFAVIKPRRPEDLYPWLRLENGQPIPDVAWMRREYPHLKIPETT